MSKEIDVPKLRQQLLTFLKQFEPNPNLIAESRELINTMRSANLFDILPKDVQEGLDAVGALCFQPECVGPPPSQKKIKKIIGILEKSSEHLKEQ